MGGGKKKKKKIHNFIRPSERYTLVNAHEINMGIKGKIKSCHYTAQYLSMHVVK